MNNTKSQTRILNEVKAELKSYWSAKSGEANKSATLDLDSRLASRSELAGKIAAAARYVVIASDITFDVLNRDARTQRMEKISDAIVQIIADEVAK